MTEAEAATYGLTVEEASGPPVDIWPDNITAHNVFVGMSTQWVVGPAGIVGLNYASLESVMRFAKIPRSDWTQLFDDIRVMEDAALACLRAK